MRELLLLALTATPPLITALLLLAGAGSTNVFIEKQLIANILFTIGSFGVGVVLASLSLPAPMRPRPEILIGSSVLFIGFAILDCFTSSGYGDSLLMADLMYISMLYRIPGKIFESRGILIAQFLPLIDHVGIWGLVIILIYGHAQLNKLGVYKPVSTGSKIDNCVLINAWFMSAVKDFYFRGHFLLLNLFGLAGPQYASILRFLELFSRPTDYLFQRLVDHRQISGQFETVLMFAVPVMLVSGVLSYFFKGLSPLSPVDSAIIGLASGFILIVKYLSFEQNSRLRHGNLSWIYLISMTLAAATLLFPEFPIFPMSFVLLSLIVSTLILIRSSKI